VAEGEEQRGPIATFRRLWRDYRRPLLAGGGVLVIGVLIGLAAGQYAVHRIAPPLDAQSASAPAPAVPREPPAVVASSPVPPSAAVAAPPAADPPATETSHQTVIEEPAAARPPDSQVAVLSVPPAPAPGGQPAWERYAVAAPPTGGRPMIAVVIDDMGLDRRRSERILQLPGPLTISFMTYADDLARQSEEARAHGHELMLHVPMEPLGEGIDPGPDALLDALPPQEIRKRVVDDLGRLSGYVGINNHMGSKFTGYAAGMQIVMEELHRRGLLFIDSLTSEHSVGLALAQRNGVPTAGRNVFLDNDPAAVGSQLAKLEELARKRGNAIAIGHPRDATITALAAWLPTLAKKGFVLAPVTAVVRARTSVTAAAASPRG
jgi:uncharacterized protein